MKTIRYILLGIFILLISSCRKEDYGPSVFKIAEQTYGTMLFSYGAEKQFNMTSENIKVKYVKSLKGWTGELEADVLTITAPREDTEAVQAGKIGLYARGYDDVEYVLWIEVKVTDDAKDGQPAGFIASFEECAPKVRLWKDGDSFRVYDEYDSDGFEFKSMNAIPESGSAEVLFNGVLSENAVKAYAVYPADRTLACTAEGVVHGLELTSEQAGVADGYADSLYMALAQDNDGKMELKSPYALLKIELVDSGVKKVVVTDIDGDCALAGKYTCDITTMNVEVSKGMSFVALVPSGDNTTLSSGVYYLVALPQNLSGIKIDYETSDGKIREIIIDAAVELERNTVFDLGSIKISSGTGTEGDPYLLRTVSDLQTMSDKLTSGGTLYFELANDIDLTGVEWIPVSDGSSTIHFNGNGKTISNLTCSTGKASFFGNFKGSCVNVSFTDATVQGVSDNCGIVAGEANGSFSDVYVSGTVTSGFRRTGGMIGYLTGGSLDNCDACVSVTSTAGNNVGGFVGQAYGSGEIRACNLLNGSQVTGAGLNVGGIAGYSNMPISDCLVKSSGVYGNGSIGGIVGASAANVADCVSNTVTVSGTDVCEGAGLVAGVVEGASIVSRCAVARGSVTSYRMAGGIVGYTTASLTIENSYSHNCAVKTTERRAGGILGVVVASADKVIRVHRCYSTASVTAKYTAAGITGYDSNKNGQNEYSECIVWNSKIEQTEGTETYSSGAVVGYCGTTYKLSDCLRQSTLNFVVPDNLSSCRPVDQANCDGATSFLVNGTYADNGYGWQYLYPYHGKSTELTTVSAAAKSLSWDETVWNLDGDLPVLI